MTMLPTNARVSAFNRAHLANFDQAFTMPVQTATLGSELSRVVYHCYRAAAEFRCQSGIQEELEYDLAAYNDKYDPKTAARIPKDRDVYVGLTSLKCRALQGWLQDILLHAQDKPWTLSATPQPQLPPNVEEQVVDMLEAELLQGNIDPEGLREALPGIRSLANSHASGLAQQALEGMQQRILDLMTEAGWRAVYEHVFVDVSVFPAAIVKGPVVRMRKRMRWNGQQLEEVEEPQLVLERVSPFDFFPSADSTTAQDGQYVVERVRMSRADMMDASKTHGFNEIAIRRILRRHPNGNDWWGDTGNANDEASKQRARMYETGVCEGSYKVLCFYGKIERRMLIEYGVAAGDPQDVVEAEIWVCDNEVMRAEINPRPLGRRPFDVARFQPIPGSFWGRSLPWVIKDPQRIVNAAARALVGNMGLASGPIFEMDHTRLEGEVDPQDVSPWRVYFAKPDMVTGSNAPAIRTHRIDSVSGELQAIVQAYSIIMDDTSGIPAFAIGSPQTSGAGRTLGGLSMLLGNAARGIKRVIGSMDKDMIEPLITAVYYLEMMYGTDASIKTDAQVVARGSSGLLQRQLNQTRAVELLQIMAPFLGVADEQGNALVPVQGLRRVLFDIVQSMGYTKDEVLPDPNRPERLRLLAGAAGAQQAAPQGGPPGTPPPPLDGRSAPPPDVPGQSAIPLAA